MPQTPHAGKARAAPRAAATPRTQRPSKQRGAPRANQVTTRQVTTRQTAKHQTASRKRAERARQAQRKRLLHWGSALAALVVAGVLGWGLLSSHPGGASAGNNVSIPDFYGVAGQVAQNFTLRDLSDRPVALSDFRGKRVLLNFWYAACPGCEAEMPGFARFYDQMKGQNIVILGVNVEDDATTAAQFLQQVGASYPVALDQRQQVASRYRVTATPSSFFIDSDGILRGSVAGTLSTEQLQDYFRLLP